MRILNILRDGTVYPPLKKDDLIVSIVNGRLARLGSYNRSVYINQGIDFIEQIPGVDELIKKLQPFIESSLPGILNRQTNVYITVPKEIIKKVALRYPDLIS